MDEKTMIHFCYQFNAYQLVYKSSVACHLELIRYINLAFGFLLNTSERRGKWFNQSEMAGFIRQYSTSDRAIYCADFLDSLTGNNNG